MNLRNLVIWGVIVVVLIGLYSMMTGGGRGAGAIRTGLAYFADASRRHSSIPLSAPIRMRSVSSFVTGTVKFFRSSRATGRANGASGPTGGRCG